MHALGESVLRLFPVLVLIAPGEVAATGEVQRGCNVANPLEAETCATGGIKQQLPDAVHADGALVAAQAASVRNGLSSL